MPHLALIGPLGKPYLAYEFRNNPCSCLLELHFFAERLFVGAQRLHLTIERSQRRLISSRNQFVQPLLFEGFQLFDRIDHGPGSIGGKRIHLDRIRWYGVRVRVGVREVRDTTR